MARTPASGPVRVRAYNVRFGDCVLVSFDPGAGERHILIDFGNAPGIARGQGGLNDVFAPVARDIKKRSGGRIDLLVMTHEHLDHMEGFYSERTVFDSMKVGQVWMSVMSRPDYYQKYPNAQPEKRARMALHATAERWQRDGQWDRLPGPLQSLVLNNVLALANKQRIDYVRGLAGKKGIRYLSRQRRAVAVPGLGRGVKLEILAPERDASVYYKKRGRFWLDAAARIGGLPETRPRSSGAAAAPPKAPKHVAPDEFAELRNEIAELDLADLLAIDKAANNTSLVIRLTVNGKVLLFPGDAEEESWSMMADKGLLGPVDLLKLAHHGSINGMPFEGHTDVLRRLVKPDKKTVALVCTCRGVYGDTRDTAIPHHLLMDKLAAQCKRVYVTEDDAQPGKWLDIVL
jgi:hypothetical protein